MGKVGRKITAKPQLGGKRGKRGQWRLPLTVGGVSAIWAIPGYNETHVPLFAAAAAHAVSSVPPTPAAVPACTPLVPWSLQCFIALFLFFVFMSSGGSSRRGSSQRRGRLGGASVAHGGWGAHPDGLPRVYRFRVLRELPHDQRAFTQGLQFDRICEGDGKSRCR